MLSATPLTTARAHIRTEPGPTCGRDDAGPADLERLCRLVISRRSRLQRLLEMRASGIIVRNEKRMVRAALEALLEAQIALDAPTAC